MEARGITMADVVGHMHFVSAWTYATLLDDVDAAVLPPSVGGTANFSWGAVVDQALRDGEGWPLKRPDNVVELGYSEKKSELGCVTISS